MCCTIDKGTERNLINMTDLSYQQRKRASKLCFSSQFKQKKSYRERGDERPNDSGTAK